MTESSSGTLTVLFTDVEGSVDLRARWGDERAREMLRAHEAVVRRETEGHGGREVKALGDGFLLAFSSARRAVACAVDMQRALRDQPVNVRIGMTAGEVLEEDDDLFGTTVDTASRIAAAARGGQILVAEVVRHLAGKLGDAVLVDRGPHRLKGLAEPVRLYEVEWEHAPEPVAGRTPFVGRDAEHAQVRSLLDRARDGSGAVVLLGGEPGIGKTRLTDELVAGASERGVLTLTGRCDEGDRLPYRPVIEIFAAARRSLPAEDFREALGEESPELARIMPELRRAFPDIPPPLELPAEAERHYLFTSIREFLHRAAALRPLMLVLEDLHWADESTLLLLRHAAEGIAEMPILVLATYRDTELEFTPALAAALEELYRRRLAHRVVLRRMDRGGVRAMLRAISGREPPAPLIDTVFTEAEGNPFLTEELYRDLAEQGRLFDPSGHWRLDLAEIRIPEGARLAISRRLERLSPDARQALTCAAVIGRRFSFAVLDALGELEADALIEALEEAHRARQIEPAPDGYEFSHELIRQTLLATLSPPRLQRLHLRVAEAIGGLEGRPAEVARHLLSAGALADRGKCLRYARTAGEHALEAAAYEEAGRLLEAALDLVPDGDGMQRAEILEKLGYIRRSLGPMDEAITLWSAAFDLYEGTAPATTIGRLCQNIADTLAVLGRLDEGVAAAERGLAAVGDQAPAERVRMLAYLALNLTFGGDFERGAGHLEEALSLARALGDDRLMGHCLDIAAWSYAARAEFGAAVEAGAEGAELLRRAGDAWFGVDALAASVGALIALGRLPEARKANREQTPLAMRLAQPTSHWVMHYLAASEAVASGDIERLEQAARDWLRFCRESGFGYITQPHIALAMASFWSGAWDVALARFEDAVGDDQPGTAATGFAWAYLFRHLAYRGEQGRCAELLDRHRAELADATRVMSWTALGILMPVVEGSAVLGDDETIRGLHRGVEMAVRTGAVWWPPGTGCVRTVAGIADAAAGRWDAAEQHFRAALRTADELSLCVERADARRWYARMLLERGDSERAQQLATEALAIYERLDMPRHAELARFLLAERIRPTEPEAAGTTLFRREGDYWTLAFEGRVVRLRDAKGMHHLCVLLAHPNREYHVTELASAANGGPARAAPGDAGEILDDRAMAAYRRRLEELRDEADEADGWSDHERATRARDEIEAIGAQLASAVGLGGRSRRAASEVERVRLTVTKRIKAALARIEEAHPGLGRHLATSVQTGYFCSYTPDPARPPAWSF